MGGIGGLMREAQRECPLLPPGEGDSERAVLLIKPPSERINLPVSWSRTS